MKWNDFLNPRSMLTPGIAGSVVMVIANTLWVEFMVPQKWTALTLSFLLIIPILIKFSASWIENVIYFTFNGLIVFALAINTNFAGRKLQEIGIKEERALVAEQLSTAFKPSLASTPTRNKIQINKINNIQLAENQLQLAENQQTTTTTTRTQVTRENAQTDSSDQEENKQTEKKKKSGKNEREFFDAWF